MGAEERVAIRDRCKSVEEAYLEPVGRFFCDALLKDIRYLLDCLCMTEYALEVAQRHAAYAEQLQAKLTATKPRYCEASVPSKGNGARCHREAKYFVPDMAQWPLTYGSGALCGYHTPKKYRTKEYIVAPTLDTKESSDLRSKVERLEGAGEKMVEAIKHLEGTPIKYSLAMALSAALRSWREAKEGTMPAPSK